MTASTGSAAALPAPVSVALADEERAGGARAPRAGGGRRAARCRPPPCHATPTACGTEVSTASRSRRRRARTAARRAVGLAAVELHQHLAVEHARQLRHLARERPERPHAEHHRPLDRHHLAGHAQIVAERADHHRDARLGAASASPRRPSESAASTPAGRRARPARRCRRRVFSAVAARPGSTPAQRLDRRLGLRLLGARQVDRRSSRCVQRSGPEPRSSSIGFGQTQRRLVQRRVDRGDALREVRAPVGAAGRRRRRRPRLCGRDGGSLRAARNTSAAKAALSGQVTIQVSPIGGRSPRRAIASIRRRRAPAVGGRPAAPRYG